MNFSTRIDYSDNRQIKQYSRTNTQLSGTTEFGLPFSGLSSGVDPNTIITTSSISGVTSSFSGNSNVTQITFGDSRMVLASSELFPITNTNSGDTQVATAYLGKDYILIDNNTVFLTYTGVTYDISASTITETSPNIWTGTTISSEVKFLSGGSIDYKDRMIWVDVKGITKSDNLILNKTPKLDNSLNKVLARQPGGDIVEIELSGVTTSGSSNGSVTSVGTIAPLSGTVTTNGLLSITKSNTNTDGYLSSTDWNVFNNKLSTETDPIFTASQANNITAGDITNLSNLSGVNTGDQNLSGYIPYTGGTSNVDLGVHSLTIDTDTLFVDSVNHRVGFGTIIPSQQVEITKNVELGNSSGSTPNGVIYKGGIPFISDFNYGNNGTVTTLGGNTIIGVEAGNLTMGSGSTISNHASFNTAIGFKSFRFNTDGYYSTAIGYNTLGTNTTGYQNTAIGYKSLFGNTTGYNNTGCGVFTLGNNTTGYHNTAVGYFSLGNNTVGYYNVGVGVGSLDNNDSGYQNTSIGKSSMFFNSIGHDNVANGYQTLGNNTTGSFNTAIGVHSLFDLNITVNSNGNNTSIGYNTGRGIITGINNTIIGANVSGLTSTLSNNIIIADGSGNQRINVNDLGDVGIGRILPTQKLDVVGNILASGTITGSNLSGTNTGDQILPTLNSLGAQPLDGDLTAIAALSGTTGFLKKNGIDTWILDNTTYLSGTKVDSFNTRTGAVALLKSDVEGVLTGLITTHTHNYDNYNSWNLKTNGVQRIAIGSGGVLDLSGGTDVTLNYTSSGVVTINSSDTIYTHPIKSWVDKVNLSGPTVISNLAIDSLGHLTNWTTRNITTNDINAEPSFIKNTAFNKNFGTTSGTVSEGNHTHQISDVINLQTSLNNKLSLSAFTDTAVTSKILTGLNITGNSILATDSILVAFGKLQSQIVAQSGGIVYQSSWNATTNTPTLASSVGTKGHYYIVSVAGTTLIDGNSDWKVKDWIIFNGSTWDKIDNTDSVSSVNGKIGAVSLVTGDIVESTNLYYTESRVIANTAVVLNTAKNSYPNADSVKVGYITVTQAVNLDTMESNIVTNNSKIGITPTQASAIVANTAKITESTTVTSPLVLTGYDISLPKATSGVNGYLSSTDWNTFNNKLSTETDPIFLASQANNITAGDITNLSNLSGVNTGDQDISGITTNASAILTKLDATAKAADSNLLDGLNNTKFEKVKDSYYDFDGTQTTPSFADAAWNDVSGNLVLYAKFNSTTTTFGMLVSKYMFTTNEYGVELYINSDGNIRVDIRDGIGGTSTYIPSDFVNDGVDHFIVARVTDGDISIFDNGILVGTQTSTIAQANYAIPLYVGTRTGNSLKFIGKIYKAGMLKGTFSDQECLNLSNGLAIADKYVGANGVILNTTNFAQKSGSPFPTFTGATPTGVHVIGAGDRSQNDVYVNLDNQLVIPHNKYAIEFDITASNVDVGRYKIYLGSSSGGYNETYPEYLSTIYYVVNGTNHVRIWQAIGTHYSHPTSQLVLGLVEYNATTAADITISNLKVYKEGRTLNLDGGKTPTNWYDFNHNLSGAITGATLKGLQETSHSLSSANIFYVGLGLKLSAPTNYALHLSTSTGYIDIGSADSTYSYFITDRPLFYFGNSANFDGDVNPYSTNTKNLGTSALQWNTIYGKTIYENGVLLSNKYQAKGTYDNYNSWNLKTNGIQRTGMASNSSLDLVGGTNVTIGYSAGGVVTINSSGNNYVHPAYTAFTPALTGANVLASFSTDAIGSVTALTTRVLTLANLGYTGASNANYITNNNQLTNGANYLTTTGVAADSTLWNGKNRPTNFGNSMYTGSPYEASLDLDTVLTVGESRFFQLSAINKPVGFNAGYIIGMAGGDIANRGIQIAFGHTTADFAFRNMADKSWRIIYHNANSNLSTVDWNAKNINCKLLTSQNGGFGNLPTIKLDQINDNPTIKLYRPLGSGSLVSTWHINTLSNSFNLLFGGSSLIGSEVVSNKLSISSNGDAIFTGTISEGGTLLSSKYLGISAKAADSNLLDGIDSSQFLRSDVADNFYGKLYGGTQAVSAIGFGYVSNAATPVTLTSGSQIIGGADFAGLGKINNIDISTWYGFSVSSSYGTGTVPQGKPAFSVDVRSGNAYLYGSLDTDNGANEVVRYNKSGTYSQFIGKGGSTTDWLRTTVNGIIPSTSGGASSLGSSLWNFNTIYGVTLYENNVSLSSKYLGISAKAADSNLLDGIDSSQFLRSDVSDIMLGALTNKGIILNAINSSMRGSMYRRQDVGDTSNANSYYTQIINGGIPLIGGAHNQFVGDNIYVNLQAISLNNSMGIQYMVADVITPGATVTATSYDIYHSGNSNKSTVDWNANNIIASGTGNFTGAWSSYQALFGSTNQAGRIGLKRAVDGVITGVIGYTSATESSNFQIMVSGGGSNIAFGTQGIVRQTIDTNGNTQFTGTITATDFIGTSDERLKTDIKFFKSKIIDTKYKSFRFINDKNKQLRVGVIAQELEKTNPEFIRINSEGIKSVSYIDLHSAEIAYLKDKIKKLEILINKLYN